MNMQYPFWAAAVLVIFAYAGYPLAMALWSRLRPRPLQPRPDAELPRIDVLMVVHNAEALVAAKIDNLLRQDYPPQRLRINIVCDGCTDATVSIIEELADPRLRLFAYPQRRGKSACLADALPKLDAPVILFTDVRQRLDPQATRKLAQALSDPAVGAASGELVLVAENGYGKGIDAYWRYEKMLRRLETASGSIVGATGALYAARAELLHPPPPGIILDDMWIPLKIAAGGHRIVFVPDAIAYDRGAEDSASEEVRKRRTLAGNYQLLHRWPRLAIPLAHPLALRLWGHKWLRLLAPWCLLLLLLSNLWLARDLAPLYLTTLAAQSAAYLLALLGRWLPGLANAWFPIRICTAFFSLNLAAALALPDYLRNRQAHLWQTTRLGAVGP